MVLPTPGHRPLFMPRRLVQPSSIRGRVAFLATALVLPLIALAVMLVIQAWSNQRTAIGNQLQETARALSLVADRQLGQTEYLLRALATAPSLQTGDIASFDRQARAVDATDEVWITLADLTGKHLVNTRVAPGLPLPTTIAPLTFAPGLAHGETHVSNLISSALQSSPVLSVVVPVNVNGQMRYALSLVMQPSFLNSALADQHLDPRWVAALIDRDQIVVARTRDPERFIGKPATVHIKKGLATGKSGLVESVTLDGIPTFAAFQMTPRFGWAVVVAAPRDTVNQPGWRLVWWVCSVSALIVLVGAFLSWWIGRTVVRAVDHLVDDAVALGDGRLPAHRPTGMNETEKVAHALRTTAVRLASREADLKGLNDTLEARVEERTSALDQANHTLSLRNRELQEFAHVASHDLQAPLRRIGVFANILLTDYGPKLDQEARYYLERMQHSTERMGALTRDILAFSSIAASHEIPVTVDLAGVLRELLADLDVPGNYPGGRVEVGTLLPVRAVPSQVHQLLLNLVGNALKFHRPEAPPIVKVSTVRDGLRVRIRVEDNGIGFDTRYAERIFKPFQRLHPQDAYEGTGIGLAIVRRIAERHGGTIIATSVPGEGSAFEISLPAAGAEPDQPSPAI